MASLPRVLRNETRLIPQEPNSKELAFLTELGMHVNRWVAITNYDRDDEAIVAIGDSISEVRTEAELKGFKAITFFKVPPTNKLFMP